MLPKTTAGRNGMTYYRITEAERKTRMTLGLLPGMVLVEIPLGNGNHQYEP